MLHSLLVAWHRAWLHTNKGRELQELKNLLLENQYLCLGEQNNNKMEKYNFEKIIQRLIKYNKSGSHFFENGNRFILELKNIFNLESADLDYSIGSLNLIDEKIYYDNVNDFKIREKLFTQLDEAILYYLIEVHLYKFQRKKAYLVTKNGFFPILVDKRNRIDLGFLKFLDYAFKDMDKQYIIVFLSIHSASFSKPKSYDYWIDKYEFESVPEIILWEEN